MKHGFFFLRSVILLIGLLSSSISFAQLTPVEIQKQIGLKKGSKKAIIAIKVNNPTQFMQDSKKKIVNDDGYSFFMTFNHFKLEKAKFKPSGGVLQLSNPDQGYVFAYVKAKPLALKVIGGDTIKNYNEGNKAPNLCYHDDSFYFDVIPGAVNYLGTIDQNELIENLNYARENVKSPSKWVTNAIVGEYIRRPKIIPPSTDDMDALTAYLKSERPKIVPNVVAVSQTVPFKAKRKTAALTGEFTCT